MEGITIGMPQTVSVPQRALPNTISTVSQTESIRYPEDILTISAAATALSQQQQEKWPIDGGGTTADRLRVDRKEKVSGPSGCQTCQRRKYKDVSDDSTVSFQTPTRLTPGAAESQVRAHEQQHVSHEQARAEKQGRKVVSQSVAIHYSVCPECGTSYVAGGTTTTVTKADLKQEFNQKDDNSFPVKGKINVYA